jgi:chemotaxis protein CheC
MFFLLPFEEANRLGCTVLNEQTLSCDDSLFRSCLKEIFNILSGAYFNALSDMTGLTLLYDIPSLEIDMVCALLDYFFIQIAQNTEEAIIVKTQFIVKNINFDGMILFFPDIESMRKILRALKINSHSIKENDGTG